MTHTHYDRNSTRDEMTEVVELELHALGQIATHNHSYPLPFTHTINSSVVASAPVLLSIRDANVIYMLL